MSLLNNLNFDKIEENQTGTVKRQTNIPVSFLGQVQIYFFTDKRSDRFKIDLTHNHNTDCTDRFQN